MPKIKKEIFELKNIGHTKERQRQMNDSPIKQIKTQYFDLDLEYK